MKNAILSISKVALMSVFVLTTSCSSDDDSTETIVETVEVDSSLPSGTLVVAKSGEFIAESGTPTMGTAELGTDDDDSSFVHFTSDFTTELGTGTVGVFLSTSSEYTADPANGNPDLMLIGNVDANGEKFIKLSATPDDKYTHVILWCATANIPFGNAELN
ncbi:DM13 domain-containing protein [Cellulophaga baltica]|uniref:DM13 domain-containing protein n=1 Tax=Cellulophaga TaxID=104264 RepID=UPI001C06A6A3|nr:MULTISPECIES: DM13 domain-containing protein [Cellulophaga]MBU2994959.1 DM13 domain-containing protein [Cellulophaga baltica]MDO6766354.1 DM13 domain-containing protein [Cellulophaga sp. 1_MG-2023]